ncbi:MAG: flagellar filament capping protein FliD [Spirochaetota bacterium]|nr:flagellar filament capping protein FliD [Spirochaetota bacterium]
MPVTMGGLASGIDSDKIITKLVEVEARPILQWENEKATYVKRKEALNLLKSHLVRLSSSAKELYGFRASYNDKRAISSNTSVLNASATKFAKSGNRKIEVIELASTQKIATDPITKDKKLSSGKFRIEVNGESEIIRFRGGKLQSLQRKIDEVGSELVATSYIKTFGDNYILTIESKISGQKGEIKLSGGKNFLKRIGLIRGEKGEEKQRFKLVFDSKYFTSYIGDRKPEDQNGSLNVEELGKSISIKDQLWREYVLPMEIQVKKDTLLEYFINYKGIKTEEEDDDVLPYKIEIGPEEKIVIKGIELRGYNISRVRPIEKKEEKREVLDVSGIGVVSIDKGERLESLYPIDKKAKGKQLIPIGKEFAGRSISKVIFYCNEGEVRFSNVKIITPLKGIGILEPKNVITEAKDAKLKIDGIEIVRDKNNNLDDVIKGASLNLRNKSREPVTLTIEPDIEKAIEKIKKFVKDYNDYLDYNRTLTKAEMTNKLGEYKKIKYKSGLFIGDMTIARIENALKTATSGAYPSMSDKPIKILPQIGISTGAINAEWETIKEGKLIIDEVKVYDNIRDNPDGVGEFFGSDTDGDNRIDHGFGFRVENILKPYIRAGKNIILAKIDLEDISIKRTEERIERHQVHLREYENKLRRKFSAMEKSISGAKMQQNWMKMQMKGMGGMDKGDKGK